MPVKLLTTKLKCFLTGSARYKGFFSVSFIGINDMVYVFGHLQFIKKKYGKDISVNLSINNSACYIHVYFKCP